MEDAPAATYCTTAGGSASAGWSSSSMPVQGRRVQDVATKTAGALSSAGAVAKRCPIAPRGQPNLYPISPTPRLHRSPLPPTLSPALPHWGREKDTERNRPPALYRGPASPLLPCRKAHCFAMGNMRSWKCIPLTSGRTSIWRRVRPQCGRAPTAGRRQPIHESGSAPPAEPISPAPSHCALAT